MEESYESEKRSSRWSDRQSGDDAVSHPKKIPAISASSLDKAVLEELDFPVTRTF